MNFESFLTFWMAHIEAIIQWVLAVIAGCSSLLFFRSMFLKRESFAEAGSDSSMDQIQSLVQKILDQTSRAEKIMAMAEAGGVGAAAAVPAGAGAASAGAGPVAAAGGGVDAAELARLKKILLEREEELNRLKGDAIGDKLRDQIARVQELGKQAQGI